MSQSARILEYLRSHPGGLTQLEAIDVDVNRFCLSTDEWYAFQDSPHKRHGHRPGSAVVGCPWCVRFAAMDDVFRGEEVTEDAAGPSLWDVA